MVGRSIRGKGRRTAPPFVRVCATRQRNLRRRMGIGPFPGADLAGREQGSQTARPAADQVGLRAARRREIVLGTSFLMRVFSSSEGASMVAWSALAVALSLPAQDKPYRGKYEKDPRAKEAFAKLATLEKEGLANVKEKLGLDVEPSAVVIEIEDAVPADAKTVGSFKGPHFQ